MKILELIRRPVPVWILLLTIVYATTITIFLFVLNPLPFPDRGHRCFAVKDEATAKVVLSILDDAGLPERFTFDATPTHQSVLWDNTTVLIWFDPDSPVLELPPNAISVVNDDPLRSAQMARDHLESSGYTAQVHYGVIPDASDKLALLESDAFNGWAMVFRRHVLKMGIDSFRSIAP